MNKNAACLLIMCYAGHKNDGECHEGGREGNEERVQECQHWSNRGPSGTVVLETLKDIDTKYFNFQGEQKFSAAQLKLFKMSQPSRQIWHVFNF